MEGGGAVSPQQGPGIKNSTFSGQEDSNLNTMICLVLCGVNIQKHCETNTNIEQGILDQIVDSSVTSLGRASAVPQNHRFINCQISARSVAATTLAPSTHSKSAEAAGPKSDIKLADPKDSRLELLEVSSRLRFVEQGKNS